MKQPMIDFTKLLKGYKDGWVAISDDFKHVVLHGKSLEELMEKAKKLEGRLYYFPAGESYSDFVGIILFDDNTV